MSSAVFFCLPLYFRGPPIAPELTPSSEPLVVSQFEICSRFDGQTRA